MEQQKILLKNSQSAQIFLNLKPYIETSDANDENAIDNQASQFDYKYALENDLGSYQLIIYPITFRLTLDFYDFIEQKRRCTYCTLSILLNKIVKI